MKSYVSVLIATPIFSPLMKSIFGLLYVYSLTLNAAPIKILNWWDFLSEESVKDLKEHGHEINLSVYKSNDVAVSKLLRNKENFDIAIISNAIIPSLKQARIISKINLKSIYKRRNYHSFIKNNDAACLPYLWSTTIFAFHKNKNTKAIGSLEQLIQLKNKGYTIGIIDDKLEVWSRILGDMHGLSLQRSTYKTLSKSSFATHLKKYRLNAKEFQSNIGETLQGAKAAVYGWHGAVLSSLKKPVGQQIALSIPEKRPVIGYDMICMLNTNKSAAHKLKVKKFIERLSNKKNTTFNGMYSQYFSPYKKHNDYLIPPFKNLYKDLEKKLKFTKPLILNSPTTEEHKQINKWWSHVRY